MGGHGTVLAGICFMTVLLTASYVFVDSIYRTSTSSASSLRDVSSIEIVRLKSSCSMLSIYEKDRDKVYVELQNSGNVKVVASDFWRIDVLLTYVDDATSTKVTYWCYYNTSDTSKHRWILDPAESPNPSPTAVNPLDWDPSETLSIVIYIPSSAKIKRNTSGYVIVALPSGSTCGGQFYV